MIPLDLEPRPRIIQATLWSSQDDFQANGIVLGHWKDEYVVWRVTQRTSQGAWQVHSGDYFSSYENALQRYHERVVMING